MHEPYTYLTGLTTEDLEDLLVDIRVYQRLEKGCNADYWQVPGTHRLHLDFGQFSNLIHAFQDITVIVEDELHKLRKLDSRTGSQVWPNTT